LTSIGQGKLLTNHKYQGTLCFVTSLTWLVLKSMVQKYLFIAISFYRNIFLSQYCVSCE